MSARAAAAKVWPAWLACAVLLTAASCDRKNPNPAGVHSSDETPSQEASTGGTAGQVIIAGAITRSYSPSEVSAVKIGHKVKINLFLDELCGVVLQFPDTLRAGSYPMGNPVKQLGKVFVMGEWTTPICGEGVSLEDTFRSSSGTLVLTQGAPNWSGNFKFTARKMNDSTQTIEVSGSFRDFALP